MLWNVEPVLDEPEVKLYNWTKKVCSDGVHLVGHRSDGSGRVSMDVISFDPDTDRAVTSSGRVYEVVGEELDNLHPLSNAAYVWSNWLRVNSDVKELS